MNAQRLGELRRIVADLAVTESELAEVERGLSAQIDPLTAQLIHVRNLMSYIRNAKRHAADALTEVEHPTTSEVPF